MNENEEENNSQPETPNIAEQQESIGSGNHHTEPDFIAECEERAASPYSKVMWVPLYIVGFLFLCFFLWARFAEIDVIVVGNGKVVNSGRIKVIQNLEGGIIKNIYVKEGDSIKKDQLLLQLSDTRYASELKKDQIKKAILEAKIHRLQAQADGKTTLAYSEQMKKTYPRIIKSMLATFHSQRHAVNQNIATLQKNHDLIEHELNIIKPLVKRKVLSEIEQIRLENRLNTIHGKIRDKRNEFKAKSLEELSVAETELAATNETIKHLHDRHSRTLLRSPVDGIVNKVFITTVGEVIQPGAKMIEIVPAGEDHLIIVRVKPADIRHIRVGQTASIIVSGYDYAKFGSLTGKVTNVSADSLTGNKGNTFYEVRITPDREEFGGSKIKLTISPGMVVSAKIITGRTAVLHYILNPILTAKEQAFYN